MTSNSISSDPFRAMIVDTFIKKDECKPALRMIGIQNI